MVDMLADDDYSGQQIGDLLGFGSYLKREKVTFMQLAYLRAFDNYLRSGADSDRENMSSRLDDLLVESGVEFEMRVPRYGRSLVEIGV